MTSLRTMAENHAKYGAISFGTGRQRIVVIPWGPKIGVYTYLHDQPNTPYRTVCRSSDIALGRMMYRVPPAREDLYTIWNALEKDCASKVSGNRPRIMRMRTVHARFKESFAKIPAWALHEIRRWTMTNRQDIAEFLWLTGESGVRALRENRVFWGRIYALARVVDGARLSGFRYIDRPRKFLMRKVFPNISAQARNLILEHAAYPDLPSRYGYYCVDANGEPVRDPETKKLIQAPPNANLEYFTATITSEFHFEKKNPVWTPFRCELAGDLLLGIAQLWGIEPRGVPWSHRLQFRMHALHGTLEVPASVQAAHARSLIQHQNLFSGFISDAYRMALHVDGVQGGAGATSYVERLDRCRSEARFRELHDELSRRQREIMRQNPPPGQLLTLGWREAFTQSQNDHVCDPALLPDVETELFSLRRLVTAEDFVDEGAEMHHCIAGYHFTSENRTALLYAITCGAERASMEIRRIGHVTNTNDKREIYTVVQVQGPHNAAPSAYLTQALIERLADVDGTKYVVLIPEHIRMRRSGLHVGDDALVERMNPPDPDDVQFQHAYGVVQIDGDLQRGGPVVVGDGALETA